MSLSELLSKAAELYLELDDAGAHSNSDVDDDGIGDEDDFQIATIEKRKEKSEDDVQFDKNKYVEVGSPAATLRLLKDLKEISKSSSKDLVRFKPLFVRDAFTT